jgi:tryptophan-rich sensory protein
MTRSGFWKPVIVAFILAMAVAGLGALMTDLGPWYQNLQKPSWQPPDWLFGPVWTTIFSLAALSAAFAWRQAETRADRDTIILLFIANAFFNVFWSALFFRLKRPDWALVEAVFLWFSVLVPLIYLRRYSSTSSWLLVPYLLWVTFAVALNYQITQLNPTA